MLIFNALFALVCGTILLYIGSYKSNGRRPIRILQGAVMVYFSLIYTAAALDYVPDYNLGREFFRYLVNVLFAAPVWDAIKDWVEAH